MSYHPSFDPAAPVIKSESGIGLNHEYEFHVSRIARDKYQLDDVFFALSGNVVFADFQAVREFTARLNENRSDKDIISPGEMNALGLIDEIYHYLLKTVRLDFKPQLWAEIHQSLTDEYGPAQTEQILLSFLKDFPPVKVYQDKVSAQQYLAGSTGGIPNVHFVLEELFMLWLEEQNPAVKQFDPVFQHHYLDQESHFGSFQELLVSQLKLIPSPDSRYEDLVEMLMSPFVNNPGSLRTQLEYMQLHWHIILADFAMRLLQGLDFIREEEVKLGGLGPGPAVIPEFDLPNGLEEEPERFSPDEDWMPRVVMMAKSTLVWLSQLSKKYHRDIHSLDQIPDEELDFLAEMGFTALWLIGVWERSEASRRIKQSCGNPEAESSAYSLYDYQVAERLGGRSGLDNLRYRCGQRGIRLACDMVPNHCGIDSKWVREHPDWFIHLDHPPYPAYQYQSQNLSGMPGIGIHLEDHYYDRTDAAVVFRRVDHHTGKEHFIYHGNDGTSMPWNDTAQLDYRNPELREAVIQTILHVARQFPIIRFDAAMTLTKKHYQRLWFPKPGTGGDIPTRSGYGMTKNDFNQQIPVEFWREVVDRVAAEVPDTLLLAEAFWLMEGYFVRTLGMHRVYNSAFMNMLKDEKNAEYRQLIKNTLEFNPQILKRYVNFQSNPDEETAITQFGQDDKYFGVCAVLSTMPGLCMFGHGQLEGLSEKYGMEYGRSYWDEEADWHLIHRHQREIAPLLKRRYMFAEVDQFYLYDFIRTDGRLDENVFAYSNRFGDERSVIAYNNKYSHSVGSIKTSVAYRNMNSGNMELQRKTLTDALGLNCDPGWFSIFRDLASDLWYIRENRSIASNGLFVELGAYKYNVFLDFRQIHDDEWGHYRRLCSQLNGSGVPDMDLALADLRYSKLRLLVESPMWDKIYRQLTSESSTSSEESDFSELRDLYEDFVSEANWPGLDLSKIRDCISKMLQGVMALNSLTAALSSTSLPESAEKEPLQEFRIFIVEYWPDIKIALLIMPLNCMKAVGGELHPVFNVICRFAGLTVNHSHKLWFLINRAFPLAGLLTETEKAEKQIFTLLSEPDMQSFLQVNEYESVYWFNKEAFELLSHWLTLAVCLMFTEQTGSVLEDAEQVWKKTPTRELKKAMLESQFNYKRLLSFFSDSELEIQLKDDEPKH